MWELIWTTGIVAMCWSMLFRCLKMWSALGEHETLGTTNKLPQVDSTDCFGASIGGLAIFWWYTREEVQEDYHRTWEWTFGCLVSSTNQWFSRSMLTFQGVHVGLVRVTVLESNAKSNSPVIRRLGFLSKNIKEFSCCRVHNLDSSVVVLQVWLTPTHWPAR